MKLLNKLKRYYKEAYTLGHYTSFHKILFTKFKVFPYYGFLGDNNFGDELVFEATKELFKPNILIPIKRRMPLPHRLFCYLNRKKAPGIVIGGGTLVGPFFERFFFEKLINSNKSVYVHGTGVNEEIEFKKEWKFMFGGEVYGGLRGPLSKENMLKIDIEMKIVGDAAFGKFDEIVWNLINTDYNNKNILVNIGTHLNFEGQNASRQEMNNLLAIFIQRGYNVHFLPLHSHDNNLGKELKSQFPKLTLLAQPKNFRHAENIFKQYSFVIGERLHFIVMAIITKRPFFSINYSKKHKDLLESINASFAGIEPCNVSVSYILSAFEKRSSFDWNEIGNKLKHFKELQRREFETFKGLV